MRLAAEPRRRGRPRAGPLGGRGDPRLSRARATPPASSSAESRRSRWFELTQGSVVDELVRSGSGLRHRSRGDGRRRHTSRRTDWLAGVPPRRALSGVCSDDGGDRARHGDRCPRVLPNVSLVYVVPVSSPPPACLVPSLWVSASERTVASISSSCRRSAFTISDPPTSWRWSSSCSFRSSPARWPPRSQTRSARREARATSRVYAFSRKIAGVMDLYDLLWIVVSTSPGCLRAEIVILMPEHGADGCLVPRRLSARQRVQRRRSRRCALVMGDRPADRKSTDTLPGRTLVVPADPYRRFGGCRHRRRLSPAGRRTGRGKLIEAVGNQATVAIERLAWRTTSAARQARRGPRTACRSAAADLGLARSAHAARRSIIGSLCLKSVSASALRPDNARRVQLWTPPG